MSSQPADTIIQVGDFWPGIGACVPRKEDERFLRGRGQYVADFRFPGALDVVFVRSTVAHGRIAMSHPRGAQARRFQGKRSRRRQTDRGGNHVERLRAFREPILAFDKVRYVGELIARALLPRVQKPRTSPPA